jgi:hypothetical protein
MRSTLPEHTQNELRREFSAGFESFREGAAMGIGGLVLCKDPRKQKVIVYCYSSKYFPQNITRVEAQERIATAKEELAHLLSLFPALREEIGSLEIAFYFCHDDGKTAVCVAKEQDGQFVYDGPQT